MIPIVPILRAGALVVLGLADVIARAVDRRQARRREGERCPACDGRPATSCPVCGVVGG